MEITSYDYLKGAKKPRPFSFDYKNYEGNNILVVSGIHGNEQLAVLSSYNAYSQIRTENLINGTLSLYMGVNSRGLVDGTREYPQWNDPTATPEDRNINRAFRSEEDKTDEFQSVIAKTKIMTNGRDIVIDVHNSPSIHHCVLVDNGPYARAYVKWCIDNNIPYILRDGPEGTLKARSIEMGQVGFTVELGGMGDCMFEGSIQSTQVEFLIKLITALSKVEDLNNFKKADEPFPPIAKMQGYVWHGPYGFIEYVSDVTQPNHTMFNQDEEIGHMLTEDGSWHPIYIPQRGWICCLGSQSNVAVNNREIFYYQPDCSLYLEGYNEN